MLLLSLVVKELYLWQLIIPYQQTNLLTSQQSHNLIKQNHQTILEILHHVDCIPYVTDQDMGNVKKKGNQIANIDTCPQKHANYNLSNKGDVKKFISLKKHIERTGLVLAKHAEENALEKYNSNIGIGGRKKIAKRKLHIIVIRINKNNEITESKPCSHCVEVMLSYGIRKVTYSTSNGDLVTESLNVIVTYPSVGYRSVERAINILDEMIEFHSKGIG